MKRTIRIVLVVVGVALLFGVVYANVIRKDPEAVQPLRPGPIKITWSTDDETGVLRFRVLRSSLSNGVPTSFIEISPPILPRGNGSDYEYTDDPFGKTADYFFVYKVRIYFQDRSILETKSTGTPFVSSAAKRTWGSIKAMFR
jgi:hypothetical protein